MSRTLVAVYDDPADVELVVRELTNMGFDSGCIQVLTAALPPDVVVPEPDRVALTAALQLGRRVVLVRCVSPEDRRVVRVLQQHNPTGLELFGPLQRDPDAKPRQKVLVRGDVRAYDEPVRDDPKATEPPLAP